MPLPNSKKRAADDHVIGPDIDETKQSWETLKVPGFDDMVSEDQLFLLCTLIGEAIFKSQHKIVVFEGPGKSGKSVMCRIIQKLAEKNNICNVFLNDCYDEQSIGERLQCTMQRSSICFDMDVMRNQIDRRFFGKQIVTWRDIYTNVERHSFWRAPIFVCSNIAIQQSDISAIEFQTCAIVKPDLLNSIDIDLVAKKCMLAAMMCANFM